MSNKLGVIVSITGVSASGKSFLMRNLKSKGYVESVSHTTRKPRPGEINGIDFHFIDKEDIKDIEFVETDEWAGNFYGTSMKELETKLKNNKFVFVIINEAGAKNLKQAYPDNVKKVFVSITKETMNNRLEKRVEKGEISESDMKLRIDMAYNNLEFYGFKDADLVLDGTNPKNIDVLLEYLKTNDDNSELERKFTVNKNYMKSYYLADIFHVYHIEQYYKELENIVERFRRKQDYMTREVIFKKEIKSQNIGLKRKEIGFDLFEDEYLSEIKNLDLFIKKDRVLKEIRQNGLIFISELDKFYHDEFDELIVEFEFFNERQAELFEVPKWCIKEVTNDKNYRNGNIAKMLRDKRIKNKKIS